MGKWIASLAPYNKAIRGAATAGLVALAAALADGHVTSIEWIAVALAVLGVGEAVHSAWNITPSGVPMPGGSFPLTTQPPAVVDEGLRGTTYTRGSASVGE